MKLFKVILKEKKNVSHWDQDNHLLIVASDYENALNKTRSVKPADEIQSISELAEHTIGTSGAKVYDVFIVKGRY